MFQKIDEWYVVGRSSKWTILSQVFQRETVPKPCRIIFPNGRYNPTTHLNQLTDRNHSEVAMKINGAWLTFRFSRCYGCGVGWRLLRWRHSDHDDRYKWPPTDLTVVDMAAMVVLLYFIAGSSDRGTGVLGFLVTKRYRGFPQSLP